MDGAQDMELPMTHATGADDQFVQLTACKIPDGTQASLIQDGWTVQLFACCALSLEQFDSDLHQLSLPEDSAIAKAGLRLLWRQCQASLPSTSLASQAEEPPTASQDTSWLDPFPPKVSAEVLGTLKKDFLSNYPAELLSSDVLPGPRMLAWLRRNLQDKQWRFCAWKYRLSVKLDKAIHEVVHVRASLATLLQPRPALPAGVPTPQHPRGQRVRHDDRKGDDRHKGKGRGKSIGKGKGPSGKQAMRQQWATTLDGKSICLRFNGNKGCQEKNCRFLHVCCVQDPATGKACGGKHLATVHKGTPH